ncbi:VCBS repeat-containing protein [Ekhidna sp. To15]|uniref:VCBS repeat-containing protein n=1 Tax=Ekhidna sp. To15 TaxID=3395267 RepID=UPI003F520591
MNNRIKYHIVFSLFAMILFSCNENEISNEETLFKTSLGTGISFINQLKETPELNPFIYDNIYSGSGVAIGDINGDGLPDLYFGGNQVKDELYLNKGNLKFEKITEEAGILNKGGWTSGVSMVDINEDGFLDIYVCKTLYDDFPELRTNELYINNGDGTFSEKAQSLGLADPWRSQQAIFMDYDKDGDLDLFLVNQPPNPGILSKLKGNDWRIPLLSWRLMRNDDGYFNDVTEQANVNDIGYGLSAVASDFNNDGWMDLYVTSDYNNPDYLYINQGDGTFSNVVHESMGHITYFSMGVDASDFNNDGWSDLVVVDMVAKDNFGLKSNMSGMNPEAFWSTVESGGHYQYMMNTLQLNQGIDNSGNTVFSDISLMSNTSFTDWSWTPLFSDFDNDGLQDLFVSNGIYRELRNTDAIAEINKSVASYAKQGMSKDDILSKAINSLIEIYPQRRIANFAFKNESGLKFSDSSMEWGLDDGFWTTSAAYGDLDLDGDLDLVVNNLNDTSVIYQNLSDQLNENNYLKISVPTGAIGTKVQISYSNGETSFEQFREVNNIRGFYSSVDPIIHFGLGKTDEVESIKVIWNDGTVTNLGKTDANQTIIIDKSSSKVPLSKPESIDPLFTDKKSTIKHSENDFDDFEREILLPHKLSDYGPKLSISSISQIYLPGAVGFTGKLIGKNGDTKIVNTNSNVEEVSSLFFDADNDGDDDLYVVVGGNEYDTSGDSYQDLFYENVDGEFTQKDILPSFQESTIIVRSADYDGDGDYDLFVGGRLVPGNYPLAPGSRLYKNMFKENGELGFEDITETVAPELLNTGMVNDATWSDYDVDGDLDLIVVGEWMPVIVYKNELGSFTEVTRDLGLTAKVGWWFHVTAADIDNDGDEDYLLGNLGLNYKYKASEETPFSLYSHDFDSNGRRDIVLSYFDSGKEVPLRGKSCSSQQIPDLKKKIKTYNEFASLSVDQIYGDEALDNSINYKATTFESVLLRNDGGTLVEVDLPIETQVAPLRASVFVDLNGDGLLDIIFGGNLYGAEIETPRADASVGGVLMNKGDMIFESLPANTTKLYLNKDVRDMLIISNDNNPDQLIVSTNNDSLLVYEINPQFKFE